MRQPTLLAIDDEPGMLALIERAVQGYGFDVACENDPRKAIEHVSRLKPDLVIVDLKMPAVSGLDVLRAVRDIDPQCGVILVTAHASVDTAIEAVKLGALDYLTKPLDVSRLRQLLTSVRAGIDRRETLLRIDADVAQQFEFHEMIGRSAAMQDLFDSIRRLAPHVRTVLVTGETGTGKELVARALHKLGQRRERRFATVNCSAVVETLFESELFGHQRGAFTGAVETKVGVFEHVDGGTLFLDEIGELPASIQPKLLRAVEYGEVQRVGSLDTKRVDVSVIAATNRDLLAEAAAGGFRKDLYYRLSIMEIRLPPLRERREDIPYLSAAFIQRCATRLNRRLTGVTTAAERVLQAAPWQGNIRELRNVIERACLLSDGPMLSERNVMAAMATMGANAPPPAAEAPPSVGKARPNGASLRNAQRAEIERVLTEVSGNKSEAARRLGVSRRLLYRWLDRLDLGDPRAPVSGGAAE